MVKVSIIGCDSNCFTRVRPCKMCLHIGADLLCVNARINLCCSNADVVNSYDDYTRTWEVIQEWKNCHRGDSYILMIMEFYGVRFIGTYQSEQAGQN